VDDSVSNIQAKFGIAASFGWLVTLIFNQKESGFFWQAPFLKYFSQSFFPA